MNTSSVTSRIFGFANSIVGSIPGGLGHVNILNSIIFAGMSGAAVADAAGIGRIEIKAMEGQGFDNDFSAAVTAASSTIGPIIPPSIPMVIFGMVANVSIPALFMGGILPGLLMGISMMVVVYIISIRRNYPRSDRFSFKLVKIMFLKALPSLLTPVILIGGILGGIFVNVVTIEYKKRSEKKERATLNREENKKKLVERLKEIELKLENEISLDHPKKSIQNECSIFSNQLTSTLSQVTGEIPEELMVDLKKLTSDLSTLGNCPTYHGYDLTSDCKSIIESTKEIIRKIESRN